MTQGPLAVTVEEEGKTRVMERFVVSAPMTGYARRIDLHVGDAVKAGQVLVAIEPARSNALDPRSRAGRRPGEGRGSGGCRCPRDARAAGAQADLARQDLERSESLRKSNFISEQALDRARSEVRAERGRAAGGRSRRKCRRVRVRRRARALASTSGPRGRRRRTRRSKCALR